MCPENHVLAVGFNTSEWNLLAPVCFKKIFGSFAGMSSCMFSPLDLILEESFLEINILILNL